MYYFNIFAHLKILTCGLVVKTKYRVFKVFPDLFLCAFALAVILNNTNIMPQILCHKYYATNIMPQLPKNLL